MASISPKNLVYNKLARQNILFVLLIQFKVVLTYCYYLYPYSSYYHHYCFYFIIIIIFYCYYGHHYYRSQYYQCYFFTLSHFISYCSYYYDFCLCVMCDVYVPSLIFFPFLINDLHFILALLIHVQNLFFLPLSFISSLPSSQSFYFFITTSHCGRIQEMNFERHGLPLPLINLGKP